MLKKTEVFGKASIYKTKVTSTDFAGKTGIVFIKDGWGPTDHIDVWDGFRLKADSAVYFSLV